MQKVSVSEVLSLKKESLKALLGTGNHSSVITKEQSSDYSNKDYREQIAPAAFFW